MKNGILHPSDVYSIINKLPKEGIIAQRRVEVVPYEDLIVHDSAIYLFLRMV